MQRSRRGAPGSVASILKRRACLTVLALSAACASPRSGRDGGGADVAAVDGGFANDRAAGGESCLRDGAGTSACGAQGESCCASPQVPSSTYFRTYASDGGSPTAEADPASVTGFRLDTYLVTVGRFRRFVAATVAGWSPPPGSGKHVHLNGGRGLEDSSAPGYEPGWIPADTINLATTMADWIARLKCEPSFGTWTDQPGPNESLPMNCIDWYEAYAFCIWDGGFLPSEAEWEDAAAGATEQREYPWGSVDPTSDLYLISDCNFPAGAAGCSGVANIAPVGTALLGAGRWGQLDLAGELAEWTLDFYAPYVDPCDDCVFLTDYSYRVVRGGSFGTDTEDVFPSARDGDLPESRNAFYGARCARAP
jgi:sulfatase modifying factor 1